MGQIHNSIVERKLAQKAGYKTAREFFSKHFADLSQATLSMYGAVAAAFTAPVTQRHGVTRLYLLLIYKKGVGIGVNLEQPGDTPIEVLDDQGQLSPVPFKTCTVDQLRQALRRKRKPASSKPLPPGAEALAEQYRAAVAARFPSGRGTRVKVLLRNEKGRAVLDFKGIPVEQVHQLLEALESRQPSGLGVAAGGLGLTHKSGGGSAEGIDDEGCGHRAFEDGRPRLRLGQLPHLIIAKPGHRAERNLVTVWWVGFVVPDDNLRPAGPDLPVQACRPFKRSEAFLQHALNRAVVERDPPTPDLIRVEIHQRAIPNVQSQIPHDFECLRRAFLWAWSAIRAQPHPAGCGAPQRRSE